MDADVAGLQPMRALEWGMLDRGSEDLVMGKTLAAWIMVAGAVAAPAMGPRETVESTVGRVVTLIQDGDTVKTESATRQATDRRTELRKLARELFDFEEVTRRTLSR